LKGIRGDPGLPGRKGDVGEPAALGLPGLKGSHGLPGDLIVNLLMYNLSNQCVFVHGCMFQFQ